LGIGNFFVFLIIFVLTLSFFSNAYAEITYSSLTNRVDSTPTYCYVEPTDPEISYIQKGQWANEAEKSVKEWNSKLQASEPVNKHLWEMKYLGSGKEPLPNCDYPIYFKPWPDKSDDWFRVAGQFFYTNIIKIYFLGWIFCEVDDELVQCFNWSMIKTGPQQGGTIKHEIGHSLGLDHYFSDNPEVEAKWSKLSILPSVMISGINNHADVKQVTGIDIQKVRSVYGSEGFYAFSPEPTPKLPTPQPTPKPIPKFVPPKIPTQPFERIDITSSTIEVEPYSTEMIKIIGDISKEEFLKGQNVYLTLKKPDGSTETLKITPTRKGHFETTLVFDNDSMRGFYEIWAIYMEQRDRNMDIVFEVVTKGKKTTSPIEPIRIITSSPNISGIGEFDVSYSDDKYTFSGDLGGYNQYVRLIAENECPSKKEVHKQDYLLSSKRNTEASFTFQQLSQGKPDQCTIYLTMYDFDGIVLDQTTVNYKIQSSKKTEITQSLETHPFAMIQKQERVPEWIKNNAKWWSEGAIADNDFTSGIQFMIKENIMVIPDLPEEVTQMELKDEKRAMGMEREQNVPDWVRNNAGWWADGLISEDDFVNGIKYLVEQGIIKV